MVSYFARFMCASTILSAALLSNPTWGAPKTVLFLFIGNSYTYYPQTELDPGLPHYFQQVVESIQPDLKIRYSAFTRGFYSYEKHFKDPKSHALMEGTYDHVVLQGQSMESLEMTPWMMAHDMLGVASFAVYLPKVLDLVRQHSADITLFVNWKWDDKDALLAEGHPGLRFPKGSPRAGQKWCGNSGEENQNLIDQSYVEHTKGQSVRLSFVGRSWLELQKAGLVSEDELYRAGDWSHPSLLGSLIAALTLARDILHIDVRQNKFIPEGVDVHKAVAVAQFLGDPAHAPSKVSEQHPHQGASGF